MFIDTLSADDIRSVGAICSLPSSHGAPVERASINNPGSYKHFAPPEQKYFIIFNLLKTLRYR